MTDWHSGDEETYSEIGGLTEKELKERNPEVKAMQLESNIRECMEAVAPMKIVSLKKKKAAWITDEILEQRRYREQL